MKHFFAFFVLLMAAFSCKAQYAPVGLIPARDLKTAIFSPDGKLLTAAAASGNIVIWNTATAEKKFELKGHTENASVMSFSGDSSLLATGGGVKDASVKIWDCATGQLVKTLPFTSRVTALSFSSDKKSLVVGTDAKQLGAWSIADGTLIAETNELRLPVTGIHWPANTETFSVVGGGLGKELKVTGFSDAGPFSWTYSTDAIYADIDSKTFTTNALIDIPTGNPNAVFSPDGKRIAFNGESARVTRLHDGKNKTTIDWNSGHPRIWITPRSDDEMVSTFTPESIADQPATGRHSGIPSMAWSPDGKFIALPSEMMVLWDGKSKPQRLEAAQTADGFAAGANFTSAAFSPDGKFLAGACTQGVHIWRKP